MRLFFLTCILGENLTSFRVKLKYFPTYKLKLSILLNFGLSRAKKHPFSKVFQERKIYIIVRYPRWPREPTALSGVSPLLPGPYLIDISHFPIQVSGCECPSLSLSLCPPSHTYSGVSEGHLFSLSQSTFQVFIHGRDIRVCSVILLFPPHWTGLFSWTCPRHCDPFTAV